MKQLYEENIPMKNTHVDAAVKGSAIGALTYLATQYNVSAEIVAFAVPLVAVSLSWLSTKVGDKNTALLVDMFAKVATKAPAKKKK